MSTRDEQFREQLSYREFLREEEKRQREQEVIQAVAENLPANDSGGKPQGAPELDEDVITQRADEFRQKSADAAAKAEEYAQGGRRRCREARG